MQIAGINCQTCSRPVILEPEGRGCRQCQAVYHKECLPEGDVVCQCNSILPGVKPPRVFARRCPVCGMRNEDPPVGMCEACGNVLMVFDSQEAFQRERGRVHRLGWRKLAGALLLAATGGGLLVFTAAFFFTRLLGWFLISPVGFVAVVAAGGSGLLTLGKALKLVTQGVNCLRYK